MNKAQPVALIGAGKFTDSPATRFWGLRDLLGPVKATSYRVASRIANHLRAGHPVKDYEEFESCSLVLLCVPDEAVAARAAELAACGFSWKEKAVVLCSTWLDGGELHQLAQAGASV